MRYRTTLAASESAGPVMGCVCAGLMIAGMDSTVVGGTTYTWCQTGGPPVYPTDIQASTAPSTPKPAPAAPTTMSTAISSPVVASTDGCNKEDASPLEIGDSCEKQ